MGGRVVHAREGRRDEYRPLVSALCRSSEPAAVLDGLLELHPFRCCYIADLDAILARGDHRAVVAALGRAHPALEFWVDAGRLAGTLGAAPIRPVFGSESLDEGEAASLDAQAILSLDFRGDEFLGPRALLESAALWPRDVIVMNLERVGGSGGPDLERLAALRGRAPDRYFHAAGGVRGGADLAALARAGAAGVLLASALHDGRLSRAELAAWHDPLPGDAALPARETGPGRGR